MHFCEKCGTKIENENAECCPNCGSKIGSCESGQSVDFEAYSMGYSNTENTEQRGTENPNIQSAEQNTESKLIAALSYLGVLVCVPWLVSPQSPFMRFHAKQGLNLFILNLIYLLAKIFIGLMDSAIVNALVSLLGIPLTVFAIIGIVFALQGEQKEIPIVGKIKIIK